MADKIQEKICEIVADVLEISVAEVTPDHHFINDLGANSLDIVEFVMRLEEEFGIEIPDEASDSVRTVSDLSRYVKGLVSEPDDETSEAPAMVVALGADHAGFALKGRLAMRVRELGHRVEDLGTTDLEPCDYPDFGVRVATAVATGEARFGVLVCGTGIGMCITANKVPGVRAALVHSPYEAEMTRKHNDANVLCFGARVVGEGQALAALDAFLATAFDPGDDGRHQRRIDLIRAVEETFGS